MHIQIHKESRITEVWLTQAEREDPAMQAQLQPLYAQCKAMKYTVAVFLSGKEDIYRSTLDLLSYNKRRLAEVGREKEALSRRA